MFGFPFNGSYKFKVVSYWLKRKKKSLKIKAFSTRITCSFYWKLTSSLAVIVLASLMGICLNLMISTEKGGKCILIQGFECFFRQKVFPLKNRLFCISLYLFFLPTSLSQWKRGKIYCIYCKIGFSNSCVYMIVTSLLQDSVSWKLAGLKFSPLFRLLCLSVNTL